MGLFFKLNEPSAYEREMAKKKAHQRNIFDSYRCAEDYANDYAQDHDGWEEALDEWENYRSKKKRK